MNENKRVLFIINKHAGTGYQSSVEAKILGRCKAMQIEPTITFTEGPRHATALAEAAAKSKMFDVVFAVGGDGTVNEVAQGLVHTNQPMAILPLGSGNGLARHLGISMDFKKSLELIGSLFTIKMDSFLINDKLSVNVSGIGFDGHIANLFGKSGKRGLIGYTKLVLQEFFSFQEFEVEINIDNTLYKRNAFVLAFANSSQFGNNATVSPHASVCDGILDVCFIRKVPLIHSAGFAQKMFSGQIEKSSFVDIVQGKLLTISFPKAMPYHVDGEAVTPAQHFTISMQRSSIAMVVPNKTVRI